MQNESWEQELEALLRDLGVEIASPIVPSDDNKEIILRFEEGALQALKIISKRLALKNFAEVVFYSYLVNELFMSVLFHETDVVEVLRKGQSLVVQPGSFFINPDKEPMPTNTEGFLFNVTNDSIDLTGRMAVKLGLERNDIYHTWLHCIKVAAWFVATVHSGDEVLCRQDLPKHKDVRGRIAGNELEKMLKWNQYVPAVQSQSTYQNIKTFFSKLWRLIP